MIFIRKFVSLFGVALCATPILFLLVPSVSAQQSNNQSQMLFEMQAMRQEIAELRDMVERQAYQLRQLEKANPQAGNPNSNSGVIAGGSGYQQSGSINNNQTVTAGVPTAGQVPTVYSDTVANPNYPGGSTAQEGLNSNEYPGSVQERLPETPRPVTTTNNYPPVEERTISGANNGQQVPVYDPETYNRQQAPADNRQQAPEGNQQQAPVGNQQQAPVINPGDVAATDSNFPQPYQRDVPARQPIPNNIPTTVPPGGVVTLPQDNSSQVIVAPNATAPTQSANSAGLGEQTYYQQGFELLKQSKHDEAVTTFKKQIGDYPDGEYADDAHYWIAESLYVNRDLDQSKLYFKAIIDNFAQSPRLPDAMLKTAYIEQEQGNAIEARILLQEIIQFHPRSNAAISAKNRLADLN